MFTALFTLKTTILIRTIAAFLTAAFVVLICGNKFIFILHRHQKSGQPIRTDGPQSHLLTKKGTPTMGGLLILFSIIASTILWCNLSNLFIWLCFAVIIIFGITGFIDDYVKIKKQTSNAMTAKMKLILQIITSLIVISLISINTLPTERFSLNIPYSDFFLNLSWLYIPFAIIVITGASNAVNLSDGLDGLAGGLCLTSFTAFTILALTFGYGETNSYNNHLQYQEISIICAAAAGSCLGFLWFNSAPAKVFMGDTGSLALGALLGTIAVIIKQEILLSIIGMVFVIEALSVMIQVFWYKRTKRRIFLMAPIHHHFEQLGWKETTVVARFQIIALISAVIGLTSILL